MAGGQAIEGAKRGVLFQVAPEDVVLAGIDYETGPEDVAYNPRNTMPVDEGLVESIMRLGVLQPIGVIKGRNGSSQPVVLFGNQRVRAAREANVRLKAAGKPLVLVPCQSPLRGFEESELSEAAIAENEHRRETTALAKSELAGLHLKRCGGNFKEAAKAFGVSDNHFRQLIKLKEATPTVKRAIEAGKIGTSAAMEIATLPPDEQADRLEEVIEAGGTVEEAKRVRQKAQGTSKTSRPGLALLRKIWAASQKGEVHRDLPDAFEQAIGWILGELMAEDVDGLSETIDMIENEEHGQ
jgi:ParB family chromosome partitioning protein